MQVKELMRQPYIINKDIYIEEAAKIMSSKDVGCLLFVYKGKAVGILTDSDLLKNFGKKKKISQVMSKNIISIEPNETIDEALRVMRDNSVKRLPVVDKNNLVGIITLIDIAANADKIEGEFFFN